MPVRNIVEIEASPLENELTLVNNRAGGRDRRRTRQTAGALGVGRNRIPGERTWRNLLKSDPSVDLVHFTILRPPEKQGRHRRSTNCR